MKGKTSGRGFGRGLDGGAPRAPNNHVGATALNRGEVEFARQRWVCKHVGHYTGGHNLGG